MRTRIAALVLGVVGCFSPGCDDGDRASGPSAEQRAMYAQSRVEIETRMRELGIPGVQLAVIVDGEVLFRDALGVRSTATGEPMTLATTFLTGSMIAKVLVAEALLQLSDEGRVDLDAPVIQYLPWLSLGPEHQGVTLHELLTMRSGIWSRPIRQECADPSLRAQIEGDGEPLGNAPRGDAWIYSNLGYAMGAAVIEAVEQRPWTEVIHDRLEVPLGLTGTYDTDVAMARDHTMTHAMASDGTVTEHELDALPHCVAGFDCSVCQEFRAGAGYHASADDAARMVLAFMERRAPFAHPSAMRAIEGLTSPGYGEGYGFGYGTFSFDARGEHWVSWGTEFGGVAGSTLWIDARRFGIVLLANAMGPSIAGELSELGDVIAQRFLGLPVEPPDLSTPMQTWGKYAGRYSASLSDSYEVTQQQDGSLVVTNPFWESAASVPLVQGSAWAQFPHPGGDSFHFVDQRRDADTDVTFFADPTGVVRYMHSYGNYIAVRVE